MAATTPFFQAFGPLLFGRPARKALQTIGRLDSLQELYGLFGHLFPQRLLAPMETGASSRERLFHSARDFLGFCRPGFEPRQ